jgi:hypothetical protein
MSGIALDEDYGINQNCWGFGFCPSSIIVRKTTFQKLDLFPSSSETPAQLVPLHNKI